MALEALKLITGVGTPLIGTLGYFDALSGTWEYTPLQPPGAQPTQPADAPEVREIPPHAPLIDVRTSPERAQSAIPNSAHFELDRILAGEDPDIERDAAAVIYCASGMAFLSLIHI